MRLRMGGYQGEASVHTRAARVLGAALGAGGTAELDLVADVTASGRNATDLFPMVEGDELDLCYFASSYLVKRVPNLAVFDLPFLFADRLALYARLDGDLGARLARDIAAATGFELLGFWDNGARHFTNLRGPIHRPGDCEGLRIRTMDSALHQAAFRSLGFEPVYIDVKDYPAAVRARDVEAQENPLTNTVNFGVHETHGHLSLTGHFCGVTLVLGNRARLDEAAGGPSRAALRAAMRQATEAQRGFAAAVDAECLDKLVAAGVAVVGPDAIDFAAFRQATAGVVTEAAGAIDPAVLAAAGLAPDTAA